MNGTGSAKSGITPALARGHQEAQMQGGGSTGLADRLARRIDYLRVSVTDRCNYRCTYCLPGGGVVHADGDTLLSFDEIVRLVGCFTRLGVRRIRLTGGEPTARRDLVTLVRLLRQLPGVDELTLSTNGSQLAKLAAPLRHAGIDRLNVSIDTLQPERFARITRGGRLSDVLAGLEAARAAEYAAIKVNTVAIRGFNDDELPALCAFAWERQLTPRFIEQMPMADGALFVPGTLMSAAEIRATIAAAFAPATFVPEPVSAVAGAGPARYFQEGDKRPFSDDRLTRDPANETRRYGIISAMTEHFCDSCNRVRLSAAGALHTCLAHDDETDLRTALRSGGEEAVVEAIRTAVALKRDGHTFGLLGIGGPRKAMIQIGG